MHILLRVSCWNFKEEYKLGNGRLRGRAGLQYEVGCEEALEMCNIGKKDLFLVFRSREKRLDYILGVKDSQRELSARKMSGLLGHHIIVFFKNHVIERRVDKRRIGRNWSYEMLSSKLANMIRYNGKMLCFGENMFFAFFKATDMTPASPMQCLVSHMFLVS
ncbi:hypothetical protein WA026_022798 [Henosepilachna vigintioctopunctata]|uniref:Uncharacterized protein n=1 Tax=Henosepilachna vigintioctopunctata TaxID=420089 RepID=A0AAW1VH05_9CUCU